MRNPGIIYWQICQPVAIKMCTGASYYHTVYSVVSHTSWNKHPILHSIIKSCEAEQHAIVVILRLPEITSSMRPSEKFLPFRFKTLLRAYSHEKFTKE